MTNKRLLKFFSGKLFTLIVIVFIFFVAVAFYKDYERQQDINQELDGLAVELENLQGKKIELSRLIEILESSNYIEKEARLRLGLKKPGEKVISVPENARPKGEVLGKAIELTPEKPKPLQWFDFFFFRNIE